MSSIEKALTILRILGDPPYEMGLSEIARELDLPKSGVHKILATLKVQHFVTQNPESKKYHLGAIVLRLGKVYSRLIGLEEITLPVLQELCSLTGESVYISIWEGDRAYPAVKCSRSGGVYDYQDFIGKSLPVNSGASAKLLFAFQGEEIVKQMISSMPLEKRTPHTEMDLPLLLKEYEHIRSQGYAEEWETFNLGEVSFSVPIFGKNKRVWCCLSLAAPREHVTDEKVILWLRHLRSGAEDISYKLQFRR